MAPEFARSLGLAVLAVHVAVIAFNVFGLVVVPLGFWLGWGFVRGFRWRAIHLALLFLVAVQALLGRACFLTIWQAALEGEGAGKTGPLIARWIESLIFWPLPIWFFAILYVAVLIYAVALWRLVPPRRTR